MPPPATSRGTRGEKSAGKRPKKDTRDVSKVTAAAEAVSPLAAVAEVEDKGGAAVGAPLPLPLPGIIFLDVDGVIVPFGGEESEGADMDAEAVAAALLQQTLTSLAAIIKAQTVIKKGTLAVTST